MSTWMIGLLAAWSAFNVATFVLGFVRLSKIDEIKQVCEAKQARLIEQEADAEKLYRKWFEQELMGLNPSRGGKIVLNVCQVSAGDDAQKLYSAWIPFVRKAFEKGYVVQDANAMTILDMKSWKKMIEDSRYMAWAGSHKRTLYAYKPKEL